MENPSKYIHHRGTENTEIYTREPIIEKTYSSENLL
jgi:hypothetical protein